MKHLFARPFDETLTHLIEEAVTTFPEKFGERMMVMMVPSANMPLYISQKLATELPGKMNLLQKAIKKISYGVTINGHMAVAGRNHEMGNTLINFIAVVDRRMATDSLSVQYQQELRTIFALNHEIGHFVVRNGCAQSRHLSECAANTFAMLRQIQLFGNNTRLAEIRNGLMAEHLVLGANTTHYTVDALQRAIETAEELGEEKLSGLSLQQTATLAAKIAGDTRLTPQRLEKLRAAFEPVAEYYKIYKSNKHLSKADTEPYALVYRKAAATILEHQGNPDIVTAGQRFFNLPDKKEFVARVAEKSDFWRAVQEVLTAPIPPSVQQLHIIKSPKFNN